MFVIGASVLSIAVGSLPEGLPALIIPPPLASPIAGRTEISQLHDAPVLSIAMGVGGLTPQVGVGF